MLPRLLSRLTYTHTRSVPPRIEQNKINFGRYTICAVFNTWTNCGWKVKNKLAKTPGIIDLIVGRGNNFLKYLWNVVNVSWKWNQIFELNVSSYVSMSRAERALRKSIMQVQEICGAIMFKLLFFPPISFCPSAKVDSMINYKSHPIDHTTTHTWINQTI